MAHDLTEGRATPHRRRSPRTVIRAAKGMLTAGMRLQPTISETPVASQDYPIAINLGSFVAASTLFLTGWKAVNNLRKPHERTTFFISQARSRNLAGGDLCRFYSEKTAILPVKILSQINWLKIISLITDSERFMIRLSLQVRREHEQGDKS